MSRPINADAHATQRRILVSARRLFAQRGLAGASIRDIAKAAGVSLAMVHHYFGSKDGLYAACIDAMLDDLAALGAQLNAALGEGTVTSPSGILERAVRVGWQFARQNRNAVRLLQRSIVESGELEAPIRARRVLPALMALSTQLGALTGRAPASLRLPIQSSIFLVVRYAIASDRELADFVFGSAGPPNRKAAPHAVEDHLVESIAKLLGFTPAEAPH